MIKFIISFCLLTAISYSNVELGVDQFFGSSLSSTLKGKRIGLVTNHTGVNKQLNSTFELFLQNKKGLTLAAIFAPEHGLFGHIAANKEVTTEKICGIPIYSLYGKTRRPTEEMLKNIDVIIYDIQDIGVRSYTYASTLYYVMEEASKKNIPVIVLDRPNPLGGNIVDGPCLEDNFRSFIGYIDVPYCHGMTIGELALYFNGEYKIKCSLQVVPMKGWRRSMHFDETKLNWIPTSPYIPEADTPLFYATTGLIGELGLVNIGVGYSLPFKVIGAPWINAADLAQKLSDQKFSGVKFVPFQFTPHFGLYKGELCKGVLIVILDKKNFTPVKLQHGILGILKSMYPDIVKRKLVNLSKTKKETFCKAEGTDAILSIFTNEKYPAWKMIEYKEDKKQIYLDKRKKYLLYN